MICKKKCSLRLIGCSIILLSWLSFTSEAEEHSNDSSRTSIKVSESEFGSENGRTRRQASGQPTSDFEHIYKTLNERGLFRMCSILRNANQSELNQTLGKGKDFTIIAPSDEAFGLIPGSQFEEIKNNPKKRQEFIDQHIIPRRLPLSGFRVFDEREVKNTNNRTLHVTAYPNGFVINGANVIDGDIPIQRTRSLVQVVDKVLYPQKDYNLLQVLEENPHLTQISSFLTLSGLNKELTTNDSFTMFAPNDEAFRAVPWPVTQQMLSNNTFLRLLIANHVIPGKHYSSGLVGNKLYSIGGNLLNFTGRNVQSHSLVLVNSVPILDSDLVATNGVVQVITRIILPQELMDDCNCLQNTSTPKPFDFPQNGSLSNETIASLDPSIREMLGIDPKVNDIDRRYGSAHRNEDHFTSTPKPVSFKSMWDEIFGTSDPTPTSANLSQTTITSNGTTPLQNTTDLPFIWDFLTTEISPTTNRTGDRFTNRPEINGTTTPSSIPQSMSQSRYFTAGVQYLDDINGTTVTLSPNETASTGQPSSWTRPFYRPEPRRDQTTSKPSNATETPLAMGGSFFRPTLKPLLRPQTTTNELSPNTNTVPPYDRRYGDFRQPTNDFDSRSRMAPMQPTDRIEQTRDDPYVEQELEPQLPSNRTNYPQMGSNYTSGQPYQRPAYRPRDQSKPYQPLRPNASVYTPEDQQVIEQQSYTPSSWSNRQNVSQPQTRQWTPYSPNRTAQSPEGERELNWWDSRYTPEEYPMFARIPQTKGDGRSSRVYPSQQSRPRPTQSRTKTPRVLIPGVVYTDDGRVPSPQYVPVKDGMIQPSTSSKTYPQTYRDPYYGRQPIAAKRPHIPSRTVYSRPELVDTSYVPYYNPYMSGVNPPQIVVGEYPPVLHSQYPRTQYIPSSAGASKTRRIDPFERRRIPSPSKTNYDSVRRSGQTGDVKPDQQKRSERDLKTISEIMDSPDLMIGGKLKTFNTLKELVNGSGLWDALNRSTTQITIFMPTDDAFNSVTDGSVEQMKQNPKLVRDFLTQHILGYSLSPQSLNNNMKVKSLNGEMHLINVIEGGKIMIDGNDVIAATNAKNGIVYVTDKMLDRTGRRARSIVEELRKRPQLSTFLALLQRSNLSKTLADEPGPYTLLAPNNEAINKMNIKEVIRNQNDLNDFIKKHIIDGAVYSNQLQSGKDPLMMDPNRDIRRMGLSSDAPIPIDNSTQVVDPDITTENGVIHVIDSILNEKLNISSDSDSNSTNPLTPREESNRNARQLSITRSTQNMGVRRFTNWLKKSGLLDDLLRDGRQYTVIVPTDRAVGKLPLKIQSILNSEPKRLTSLLEYHIIPGFIDTKTLKDNEMLTTINNKQIRFNRLDNGKVLTFSGAPVSRQTTEQNIQIIAVDTVLYPPQGSVPDLITKSPLLTTLNEIIKTAKMEDELRNSSEITLFAPKDEAFKHLDPEILQKLKTDQNYSREFLRKHITPKVMFTSALQSGESSTHKEQALNGDMLKIYRKPNCVSVNGVILSFADITATNGVLHIIDHTI